MQDNENKINEFYPEDIDKRSGLRLRAQQATKNNTKKEAYSELWIDTNSAAPQEYDESLVTRAINSGYTGVVVNLDNYEHMKTIIPSRMKTVLKLRHANEATRLIEFDQDHSISADEKKVVVLADEVSTLDELSSRGYTVGLLSYVEDQQSLLDAISHASKYPYLWVRFKDPTNIPLELVIATLQETGTTLMKEINDGANVEDAIVSYGVMECGADGVVFSPSDSLIMDQFLEKIENKNMGQLHLQTGSITKSQAIGMGYRACIDTTNLFNPNEGMLVGSTSQGGILCCPEVFFLPYMELRPFRVNAGGIHSYVFNSDDKTDYMSELKSGSEIMLVSTSGKTQKATVGRVKIEKRPLRLLEVKFTNGELLNVILQDDWHVRVFNGKGEPANITELKPGDEVMGYVTDPGRHVGIKINETILEK